MSDYSLQATWSTKDALATGQALKAISATELGTEFEAISTAVATKFDTDDVASTVEAQALTANNVLITPSGLSDVLGDNAGMAGDIQALVDPNVDTLLGWDDSASAVIGWTIGTGLATTVGGALEMSHLGFEDLTDPGADALAMWDDTAGNFIFGTLQEGITTSSDGLGIGLADVAAGAAQPVVITNGTFTFDLSSITEIAIDALSQSADGVLINDAGTIKSMPIDESGIIVVNAADADQTFALADANTLQVLDSASTRVWTVPTNAAVAFKIGTVILLQSNQSSITVTADTGVTLTSRFNTAGTTATSDTVIAGGRACLIKIATNEWTLEGGIGN